MMRDSALDGLEGAVYPWDELEAKVMGARQARLDAGRSLDDFRLIVGCTEPTPERMEQLEKWGVTDYPKPPWTTGSGRRPRVEVRSRPR